jgi:hypothetical protein
MVDIRSSLTWNDPVSPVSKIEMKTRLFAFVPMVLLALTGCNDGEVAAPTPPPVVAGGKKVALTPAPVSFQDNVATVLAERCATCHIEDSKGGLNAATFAALMKGGENGPVIVPGKPDESTLVKLIESDEMPKRGGPLSDELKQDIREWVEKGAVFDGPAEDAKLLSYVLLQEQAGGMGGSGGGRGGPGGRSGGGGGWDPVERFDKDADKKLSKDEMPERMQERFTELDADKDGFVTGEEFRAGMQGRFGGGGGRGGDGKSRSPEGGKDQPSGDKPQRPAFDDQ